jgi:hypothetical protein
MMSAAILKEQTDCVRDAPEIVKVVGEYVHLRKVGDLRPLTADEEVKVRAALQAEIDRLRNLPASVDVVGTA